jgi:dihydrofolate reductase
MGTVIADISMSLDGFVAGPDDRAGRGLGEGGERLHYWVFGGPWSYDSPPEGSATGVDGEVLDELLTAAGAVVVGRRMFDCGEAWGYENPFPMPCLVLTHRADPELVEKAPTFTFVTGGTADAMARARAVAGDKDIVIGGGANVIQQYLAAGLVDEVQIHLAPVLLGAGTRLFDHLGTGLPELERTRVIESPFVTHLRYRVVRPGR